MRVDRHPLTVVDRDADSYQPPDYLWSGVAQVSEEYPEYSADFARPAM
jgi:hypothetical protein